MFGSISALESRRKGGRKDRTIYGQSGAGRGEGRGGIAGCIHTVALICPYQPAKSYLINTIVSQSFGRGRGGPTFLFVGDIVFIKILL